MRMINTDKMDKVFCNGHEIAFGRVLKNEYGEYVVKVYVDGVYDEDKTIYESTREDAEGTRAQAIRDNAAREPQDTVAAMTVEGQIRQELAELLSKADFAASEYEAELDEKHPNEYHGLEADAFWRGYTKDGIRHLISKLGRNAC